MKLHHYKTAGDKDLILEFIDNLPVVEKAAGKGVECKCHIKKLI